MFKNNQSVSCSEKERKRERESQRIDFDNEEVRSQHKEIVEKKVINIYRRRKERIRRSVNISLVCVFIFDVIELFSWSQFSYVFIG
jgi:hypothetical protein